MGVAVGVNVRVTVCVCVGVKLGVSVGVLVTHLFEPPAAESQAESGTGVPQPAAQAPGPIGCPHDEVDAH